MRSIKYIVVHCTATPQTTTIQSIQNYWRNNLKWKSPGYHQIIEANGKINRLASDETVCNGVAGYVLGSTSTALPPALNDLLPNRPTIQSGSSSPYTLVTAIGATALASGSYTLGKKAFFIVTNGTGSTNVSHVTTRDIDSNGGITILAFGSYSDQIGQPSANLFRTLNWGPLVAPSGSVYYTFVN